MSFTPCCVGGDPTIRATPLRPRVREPPLRDVPGQARGRAVSTVCLRAAVVDRATAHALLCGGVSTAGVAPVAEAKAGMAKAQ
jgi:hypothetical protein